MVSGKAKKSSSNKKKKGMETKNLGNDLQTLQETEFEAVIKGEKFTLTLKPSLKPVDEKARETVKRTKNTKKLKIKNISTNTTTSTMFNSTTIYGSRLSRNGKKLPAIFKAHYDKLNNRQVSVKNRRRRLVNKLRQFQVLTNEQMKKLIRRRPQNVLQLFMVLGHEAEDTIRTHGVKILTIINTMTTFVQTEVNEYMKSSEYTVFKTTKQSFIVSDDEEIEEKKQDEIPGLETEDSESSDVIMSDNDDDEKPIQLEKKKKKIVINKPTLRELPKFDDEDEEFLVFKRVPPVLKKENSSSSKKKETEEDSDSDSDCDIFGESRISARELAQLQKKQKNKTLYTGGDSKGVIGIQKQKELKKARKEAQRKKKKEEKEVEKKRKKEEAAKKKKKKKVQKKKENLKKQQKCEVLMKKKEREAEKSKKDYYDKEISVPKRKGKYAKDRTFKPTKEDLKEADELESFSENEIEEDPHSEESEEESIQTRSKTRKKKTSKKKVVVKKTTTKSKKKASGVILKKKEMKKKRLATPKKKKKKKEYSKLNKNSKKKNLRKKKIVEEKMDIVNEEEEEEIVLNEEEEKIVVEEENVMNNEEENVDQQPVGDEENYEIEDKIDENASDNLFWMCHTPFKAGDVVKIVGLDSEKYNGQMGTFLGFYGINKKKGLPYYAVQFSEADRKEHGWKPKALGLLAKNLKLVKQRVKPKFPYSKINFNVVNQGVAANQTFEKQGDDFKFQNTRLTTPKNLKRRRHEDDNAEAAPLIKKQKVTK